MGSEARKSAMTSRATQVSDPGGGRHGIGSCVTSSGTTEEHVRRAQVLRQFPSPDAIGLLRRLGVRYAILHMKDYDPAVLPGVVSRLRESFADLRPIRIGQLIRIYEIRTKPVDLLNDPRSSSRTVDP